MKVTGNVVIYALVALVTVGGALVAVVFVLGGPPDVVAGRAAIIGSTLGPAIGVLLLLAQQAHVVQEQAETKALVNGHLEQHIGHTDDQIRAMIAEQLQQLQAAASPLEPKPETPALPVEPPPAPAGT